jgi:hypothetical protein
MATVIEKYTTENSVLLFVFLLGKRLHTKDINKDKSPVYGEKCLSHKAGHKRVDKFSYGRSKFADDARPGRPIGTAIEATV